MEYAVLERTRKALERARAHERLNDSFDDVAMWFQQNASNAEMLRSSKFAEVCDLSYATDAEISLAAERVYRALGENTHFPDAAELKHLRGVFERWLMLKQGQLA